VVAIETLVTALGPLEAPARERVLDYIFDRFGLEHVEVTAVSRAN